MILYLIIDKNIDLSAFKEDRSIGLLSRDHLWCVADVDLTFVAVVRGSLTLERHASTPDIYKASYQSILRKILKWEFSSVGS